jgi:hypothetical protein
MQIATKTSRSYRVTPAAGVACGLIYLIAFSAGAVAHLGAVGYFRLRG